MIKLNRRQFLLSSLAAVAVPFVPLPARVFLGGAAGETKYIRFGPTDIYVDPVLVANEGGTGLSWASALDFQGAIDLYEPGDTIFVKSEPSTDESWRNTALSNIQPGDRVPLGNTSAELDDDEVWMEMEFDD